MTLNPYLRLPAPYQPARHPTRGLFLAIEGVSGSGKSTLTEHVGQRLGASTLHVIPPPLNALSKHINATARPLPQLTYYLTGVLMASDEVRQQTATGPMVTDRYVNSVIVNHAAVNDLDVADVFTMITPFMPYVLRPTLTVYLETSHAELRRRLRSKTHLSDNDQQILDRPELLDRLTELYEVLAEHDPTAVRIKTAGSTPEELTDQIIDTLTGGASASSS